MKTINLALLLALAAPAHAAFAPAPIPALTALPLTASVSAAAPMAFNAVPLSPLLPAPILPAPSIPVSGPKVLPGAWHNHQPLELPAEAAVVVPAHDQYHLDWSFLDGDEGPTAHVAMPNPVSPRPLPPAGAAAQLTQAAEVVASSIQAVEDAIFDHALAHPRLTFK